MSLPRVESGKTVKTGRFKDTATLLSQLQFSMQFGHLPPGQLQLFVQLFGQSPAHIIAINLISINIFINHIKCGWSPVPGTGGPPMEGGSILPSQFWVLFLSSYQGRQVNLVINVNQKQAVPWKDYKIIWMEIKNVLNIFEYSDTYVLSLTPKPIFF